MRRMLAAMLIVLLVISIQTVASAREKKEEQPRFYQPVADETLPESGCSPPQANLMAAAVDTYCVVWYDFDHQDWQGWTQSDNTAQKGTFFHVDDFAGLGGGSFGRLVPIEGTKSMWCGIRGVNDLYTCSWASAPGYGNGWDQTLMAVVHPLGPVGWTYDLVCDTEAPYDYVEVGYDDFNSRTVLETFDGVIDTTMYHTVLTAGVCTKLFFHFMSDGAWSDHDGLHDTDGACIIDNVTVSDTGGLIDDEDFEMYDVGETDLVFWRAYAVDGFGIYSGLSAGLEDLDPCRSNFSTVITFFHGSPHPSEDYPGLYETPFCTGGGGHEAPCQNEDILSPLIDLTSFSTGRDHVQDAAIPPGELPGLTTTYLRFDTYVDIPLSNLVFKGWNVRLIEDGCPGLWRGNEIIYYYWGSKEWESYPHDISRYISADTLQIRLGVVDMCDAWYGTYGDCAEHTPSPWYDNVRVYRCGSGSPAWSVRNFDLFQDTFPQEVSGSQDPMEEFCRADMANDLAPGDEFGRIDPGDSAVVSCAAPLAGGLDTLGTGEARVYFHCDVVFLGPDGKPDLTGAQLEGNYGDWAQTDMNGWDVFLCQPAATSAGNIAPDKYCIDLNDSLFTRGYMIEYYFKAYDLFGNSSTCPASAEAAGGKHFEFTCLPTLREVPGALFVDDYHNRGTFEGTVETYWELPFNLNASCINPGVTEIPPDRYDVNGPSSGVSNGVGAYTNVNDASSIFCTAYEMVIFDSGDLNSVTMSEGTEHSDKSNDAGLLIDWMDDSEHDVSLLVMGDQVAYDLSNSAAASALHLMSILCGVTLVDNSYFDLTGGHEGGGVFNPLVTGVANGPFDGLEYHLSGGCPFVKDFDVLEATGPGEYGLKYPDYNSLERYAGIYTYQLNNASQPLRTVWIGHSLKSMTGVYPWPERTSLVYMATQFFERAPWGATPAEIPAVTSLADNFPNPFNPSTRVKFGLAKKGHVSIRIYDVSGRLVRILIDEVREAGAYEVVWDGANDRGRATASGIYFCRMEAPDYERTLKMVLLR